MTPTLAAVFTLTHAAAPFVVTLPPAPPPPPPAPGPPTPTGFSWATASPPALAAMAAAPTAAMTAFRVLFISSPFVGIRNPPSRSGLPGKIGRTLLTTLGARQPLRDRMPEATARYTASRPPTCVILEAVGGAAAAALAAVAALGTVG